MMKKIFFYILLFIVGTSSWAKHKSSGIFYSTLYANQGEYLKISGLGLSSSDLFFADVDGDGKDDAVSFNIEGEKAGTCEVALSNGEVFKTPATWLRYYPKLSFCKILCGDINGDGKADLCFIHKELNRWEVALSDGVKFMHPIEFPLTNLSDGKLVDWMVADMNGDKRSDALYALEKNDSVYWYVAFAGEQCFSLPEQVVVVPLGTKMFTGHISANNCKDLIWLDVNRIWNTLSLKERTIKNLGVNRLSEGKWFLFDIDGDQFDDLVSWNDCDSWYVSLYKKGKFQSPELWISGHKRGASKNNVPQPSQGLIGSMNGRTPTAMVFAYGSWWGISTFWEGTPCNSCEFNTYESWGNNYVPQLGCYDAGDSLIHQKQIQMIYNAGFNYIMLDITNGKNDWVDNRAKSFIRSILRFNKSLNKRERKLYFCIAMGGSRGKEGLKAVQHIEMESQRTWEEFYKPYEDIYYKENGNPLLVHFVEYPRYRDSFVKYQKQHFKEVSYSNHFKIAWMFNFVENEQAFRNAYGWDVGDLTGNPDGENMAVMPGFYNGLFEPVNRERGEFYRRQWLRVLLHNPSSVWVNSFNETWEHTSVEPAFLTIDKFVAYGDLVEPWTDLHGNRMDDFYWIMTKQYNQLYMKNILYLNSYIQEEKSDDIYKVTINGFIKCKLPPTYAPVLLVPEGFLKEYNGEIMK